MKRIFYLLPALFFIISACEKDKNKDSLFVTCPEASLLEGQWDLNAYWNSPGVGDLSWTPATGKTSIHFTANGLFSGTEKREDHYYTTIITNDQVIDTIVKLYKQGSTDTSAYFMKLNRDTLCLYFIGCNEGCAEKYARPGNPQQ